MKKKYIAVSILVAAVAMLSLWLLIRPKPLGNLSRVYSEPETSASTVSFSGNAGDRIRFVFASDVESGTLSVTVHDSKGNIIEAFDQAKRLKTFFSLNTSDTYTLKAECREFSGSFKAALYLAQ